MRFAIAANLTQDHSLSVDAFIAHVRCKGKFMDMLILLIVLLLLFGGGGGLYWGLGVGWGVGPIGLILAVLVVAFLLNGVRGRRSRL